MQTSRPELQAIKGTPRTHAEARKRSMAPVVPPTAYPSSTHLSDMEAVYTPPPPPSHNGGLYTGEPFLPGAPWRNFPAVPDSSYLVHVNLRSANPPTDALFQYPAGNLRPGNSYTVKHGITSFSPLHQDLPCAPTVQDRSVRPKFAKYTYI